MRYRDKPVSISVVSESDLLSKTDLESVQKGLDDIKNGRVQIIPADESLEEFLDRI